MIYTSPQNTTKSTNFYILVQEELPMSTLTVRFYLLYCTIKFLLHVQQSTIPSDLNHWKDVTVIENGIKTISKLKPPNNMDSMKTSSWSKDTWELFRPQEEASGGQVLAQVIIMEMSQLKIQFFISSCSTIMRRQKCRVTRNSLHALLL